MMLLLFYASLLLTGALIVTPPKRGFGNAPTQPLPFPSQTTCFPRCSPASSPRTLSAQGNSWQQQIPKGEALALDRLAVPIQRGGRRTPSAARRSGNTLEIFTLPICWSQIDHTHCYATDFFAENGRKFLKWSKNGGSSLHFFFSWPIKCVGEDFRLRLFNWDFLIVDTSL